MSGSDSTRIRPANLTDLTELLRLERACFDGDRLSPRSFRHLLTKGKASTLVWAGGSGLLGYALTLFHAGTSLGRLYSLAVEPAARGRGIARALVEAAEREARERGCAYLRLEVRTLEVPFILEDGQTIARLVYEELAERPNKLYGRSIASHYQGQGLKLSKHFR